MSRFTPVALSLTLAGALAVGAFAAPEPPAPANGMTVDQLLDNMEGVRQTVKTFKADVIKKREVLVLEETETFTGFLEFKTPRLLRLQLKSKENGKEIIYIVGPTYGWIYRVTEKQAERGKLTDLKDEKKSGNPLEYGLARDMHGLKEGFKLKLLAPEKIGAYDTVPLEMTPDRGEDYAAGKLVFWIDTKSWLLVQVREFKSNNEIVETNTFSNVQINAPVSDQLFEFEPPKGVEVILHDAALPRR